MAVAVVYGMLSNGSGYALEKHELVASAPGTSSPAGTSSVATDGYEWKQTVGAEGDRVLTSANSSRIGGNSEGHITEITRNRDETTTWRRLMPATNSWTNGGNITADSFLSSDTG